jgi:hypothetical protein
MLDRIFDRLRDTYDRLSGDEEGLRESGIAGTAEILGIEDTGKAIGVESHGQDSIYRVHVRVTIPGKEPYELQHETVNPPYNAKTVPCFVHPDDHKRIYLDRDAGAAAEVAEQMSAASGQPVSGDWASVQAAAQAMGEQAQKQAEAMQAQFAAASSPAPAQDQQSAEDQSYTAGRARVISAQERAITLPTGAKLFDLELEVTLPEEKPYQVAVLSEVPGQMAEHLQPGLEVTVKVADTRRTAVLVDWEA